MLSIRTGLRLADIFWPTFVERGGIILLESVQPTEPPPGGHASLTEYERFHGHTHLQDLFRWNASPHGERLEGSLSDRHTGHGSVVAWSLAKRMAEMWLAKLQRDFPTYRFRVYASRFDDPIVHFHRVRDSEPVWISDSDAADGIARDHFALFDSVFAPGVAARQANER